MADLEHNDKRYKVKNPNRGNNAQETLSQSPIVEYPIFDRPFWGGHWLPEVDMTGKTTLEIHARNALWSFAMEDAGAARCVAIEPHPIAAQEAYEEISESGSNVEFIEAAIARDIGKKQILYEGSFTSPYHADVWQKKFAAQVGGPIPSGEGVYEVDTVNILDVYPDPPDYIYADCGSTLPLVFELVPDEWLKGVTEICFRWSSSRIEKGAGFSLEIQVGMLQWYLAIMEETHVNSVLALSADLSLEEHYRTTPSGLYWVVRMRKKTA